jgi:hypothetical protein
MKKITLIAALGLIFSIQSVFAQSSFTVTNGGVNYPDNSHYYVWFDVEDSIAIGGLLGDYTGFLITNNAATSKNVKIRKDQAAMLAGASSFFCWAACYGTGTDIAPDSLPIAAGATSSALVLDFNTGGILGESIIKYTVYNSADGTDKISFFVHYQTSPSGINSISKSVAKFTNVFPNPASSNVTVSYASTAGQSSLEVRNMLGQVKQIINLPATSKNYDFSVADYAAGIYFITLKVNGVNADTKRLVVK